MQQLGGAAITLQQGRTIVERRPVCTALYRPDAIPLPAAQDCRKRAVSIPEEWHLPNVSEREAMTNIKDGIAPIQTGQCLVRRKSVAAGRSVHGRADALPR